MLPKPIMQEKGSTQQLQYRGSNRKYLRSSGPNGAGKTSFIRIINQITQPDSGEIL